MLMAAVVWSYWKEHNAHLFMNKCSPIGMVASTALNFFDEWSVLCKPTAMLEFGKTYIAVRRTLHKDL